MRDRRLKSVEAVIQRQQRVPPKRDHDSLFLKRKRGRPRLLRAGPEVRNSAAALPLADGLLVDAVAPRQRPQALLTMLYRTTDRLRRAGAPMQNLAHSASFHFAVKSAPSNSGIKHLAAVDDLGPS